jgi:hypothetical protein
MIVAQCSILLRLARVRSVAIEQHSNMTCHPAFSGLAAAYTWRVVIQHTLDYIGEGLRALSCSEVKQQGQPQYSCSLPKPCGAP